MAETMFKEEQSTKSRKTWRMIVIGAAVPFAMLAAAPAVSAAETDQAEVAVQSEQLPGLPLPLPDPGLPVPGVPDPQALLDLQQCLADVQALLPADVPAPAEAEQLPVPLPDPGGLPALPDLGALNDTCQAVLATLQAQVPPVDVPAVPAE